MRWRRNIALICTGVVLVGGVIDAAVLTVAAGVLRDAGIGVGGGCGRPTDDPVSDRGHRHFGTTVDYPTVPPSSGPHYAVPASPRIWFYSRGTAPHAETLVHNLEHGYTVIWYDDAVTGRQLDDLRTLAGKLGENPGKVIVAAWDTSRGRFPGGEHVALAHWGARKGHRQYCRRVNAVAISAFITRFPRGDAPEPMGW